MQNRKQVVPERKVITCSNCGQEREHAAYGLCATCYQRQHRAEDDPWAAAPKHDAQRLRAQRTWRRALIKILDGVEDGIDILSEQEAATIRTTVQLHLSRLVNGLPPAPLAVVPTVQTPATAVEVDSIQTASVNCQQWERFQIEGSQVIPVGDQSVLYVPQWLPDPEGWYAELELLPWSGEGGRRQTVSYGDIYRHDRLAGPAATLASRRPYTSAPPAPGGRCPS